jgi:SurA N-terminal domain
LKTDKSEKDNENMKYVYYILVILVIFSGLAAYGIFGTRVEISKPVLSVNDRIISEAEFESALKEKPSQMSLERFSEFLIDKQLLIQEAVKMKIDKEESFRRSVENFYEQSLIKTLLERKRASIIVDVTIEEMGRYEELSQSGIFLTRFVYPTIKDMQDKTNETVQDIESDFVNLPDDLRFALLFLDTGEFSKPFKTDMEGVLIYRLNDIQKKDRTDTGKEEEFDGRAVSLFIQDKKKEARLDEWLDSIRKSAAIWRKK